MPQVDLRRPLQTSIPGTTSPGTVLTNLDLFSPTLAQTQLFTAQPLQSDILDVSPVSMGPFSINSILNFDPTSLESQKVESTDARMDILPEISIDQFVEDGGEGDAIGIDVDDPILSSLATLAEGGGDLGEQMGETQNFNVWEWFEQQ